MRPMRRDSSPQEGLFSNHAAARPFLVQVLGKYCCYCERYLPHGFTLEVEHIQPKSLPQYKDLYGEWTNYLLACRNCNATKGNQDVVLSDVLLPDRDNTFVAFEYTKDGGVEPATGLTPDNTLRAAKVLSLTGQDKAPSTVKEDELALERVGQRMQAWIVASEAQADYLAEGNSPSVINSIVKIASTTGFFSIWMKVFEGHPAMRLRFVEAFNGTLQSSCFDPTTSAPVTPAPNPDGLAHGGRI